MMSLHVDLNKAAKCVDIIPPTLLASLSRLRTFVQVQNGDDIWPNFPRLIVEFMKVQSLKTWKELTTGVEQLVRLLFNNNFINVGLVLSQRPLACTKEEFAVLISGQLCGCVCFELLVERISVACIR